MRIRPAVMLCAALLTGSSLSVSASVAAVASTSPNQEAQAGKQVMPLLMNNMFVLFPGEKAPFIKNSRLMAPLQTMSSIMGWRLEERASGPEKWYNVWPILEDFNSVGGLKEGRDWAVYEGDMGHGIEAEPEYRADELYVPLTPILNGMPGYSYEVRKYGQNNVLAIMDPSYHRLLSEVQDSDVQQPNYPHLLSDPVYPLIPSTLDQRSMTVDGKSMYRLKMNLKQIEVWSKYRVESIDLKLISVSNKGEITTLHKSLPYNEDWEPHSVVFDVPQKAAYVLAQSHYNYKNMKEPIYAAGYPLQAAMAGAMAKVWTKITIFEYLNVEPVSYRIDSNEAVVTVRERAWHREGITDQVKEKLIQSIYELAGGTFPVRVEIEQRSKKPYLSGTITEIDSARRLHIVENKDEDDSAATRQLIGSPVSDLYIHKLNEDAPIADTVLTVGRQVDIWVTGQPVERDHILYAQIAEIVVSKYN
ncbi:hypothetical protein PCCS19_45270 [Paenibacillus sp. CCS19]|uniref:hypothetical protein n=1 Tax=Paenibacillus sp. CCS19 TaxID=3158387 RepID=UPI00256C3336|nr:hypothetical protein [Paenibacillus cellulosilyticus]GMK41471.1 hypothetical protein PCCS19_45270 [Paenibacillus cellulosilyticus]